MRLKTMRTFLYRSWGLVLTARKYPVKQGQLIIHDTVSAVFKGYQTGTGDSLLLDTGQVIGYHHILSPVDDPCGNMDTGKVTAPSSS